MLQQTHITSLQVVKQYKTLKEQTWNNIPQFAILTGENGSGKSTLFEVLGNYYSNRNNETSNFCRIEFNDDSSKKWLEYNIPSTPFLLISDIMNSDVDMVDNIESSNTANIIIGLIREINSFNKGIDSSKQYCIERKNEVIKELESILQDDFNNMKDFINSMVKFLNNSFSNNESNAVIHLIDFFPEKYKAILLPRHFSIKHLTNIATLSHINMLKKEREKYTEGMITVNDLDIETEKLFNKINNILENYGFKYKIKYKPLIYNKDMQLYIRLENTINNKEINLNDLSTGEQAILNLLTATVSKNSQVGKSIIMLDEPDARLNPKMTKTLFKVIKEVLVEEYGLQVIITTHNPVTAHKAKHEGVALFKMEDGKLLVDQNGKSTISGDEIVNSLLDGVITLDDFSSMFQELGGKSNILLVEGKTDVVHYKTAIEQLNGKKGIDINLDNLAIIAVNGEDRLDKLVRSYPDIMFKGKKVVALFDNDTKGRQKANNLINNCNNNCYRGDKEKEDKECYIYTIKTPEGYKKIGNTEFKEDKFDLFVERLYDYKIIQEYYNNINKELSRRELNTLNNLIKEDMQFGNNDKVPEHIMFYDIFNKKENKNHFSKYIQENANNISFDNFILTLEQIQQHFKQCY